MKNHRFWSETGYIISRFTVIKKFGEYPLSPRGHSCLNWVETLTCLLHSFLCKSLALNIRLFILTFLISQCLDFVFVHLVVQNICAGIFKSFIQPHFTASINKESTMLCILVLYIYILNNSDTGNQ